MSKAPSKTAVRPELPGEVLELILAKIPSADAHTLATLLRVSKLLCRSVAHRLYANVVVTADCDLMVDMAIPGDLLDEAKDGGKAAPAGASTLKHSFLALIKTIDVYPRRLSTPSADDGRSEGGAIEPAVPQRAEEPPSSQSTSSPIPLDQLRLRLDTSSYQRASPYNTASDYEPPSPAATSLLASLRPRQLILHGAGFHQGQSPITHLPPSLFGSIKEIFVVVTPGAMPEGSDMLSMNHGLPYIMDCLSRALLPAVDDDDELEPTPVNITFILQTPRPGIRFPPIDPVPHGSMAMTMDYHPDYAPGYLHALTTSLSQRMVVMRTMGSVGRRARVGSITFVGFGMLGGEQVGMPQAAEAEMEDRFERGLRVRLRRAGVSEDQQGLKVVPMLEWLNGVEGGGQGVLDEHILRGWRR